jgi:hypothetical protein
MRFTLKEPFHVLFGQACARVLHRDRHHVRACLVCPACHTARHFPSFRAKLDRVREQVAEHNVHLDRIDVRRDFEVCLGDGQREVDLLRLRGDVVYAHGLAEERQQDHRRRLDRGHAGGHLFKHQQLVDDLSKEKEEVLPLSRTHPPQGNNGDFVHLQCCRRRVRDAIH